MKIIEPYHIKIRQLDVGETYYDTSPQLGSDWGTGHLFFKLNYETMMIVALKELEDDEKILFELSRRANNEPRLIELWSETDLIHLRLCLTGIKDLDEYDSLCELKELVKSSFQDLSVSQFFRIKELSDECHEKFNTHKAGTEVEEVIAEAWIEIHKLKILK